MFQPCQEPDPGEVRAHVFGFMTVVIKGDRIRTIGLQSAKRTNCLVNLFYNLARITQLGVAV